MSDTRYLILLPLKFPEGKRVPAEYITETQIELACRFGGATLEPGRVSGMWVDEGQLVEDELVKWTTAPRFNCTCHNSGSGLKSVFARRSFTSLLNESRCVKKPNCRILDSEPVCGSCIAVMYFCMS